MEKTFEPKVLFRIEILAGEEGIEASGGISSYYQNLVGEEKENETVDFIKENIQEALIELSELMGVQIVRSFLEDTSEIKIPFSKELLDTLRKETEEEGRLWIRR